MSLQSYGSKIANYEAKHSNTGSVKFFSIGSSVNLWKPIQYSKNDGTNVSAITTAPKNIKNLYIQGDLFIDGSVINPSDIKLKKNICLIDKTNADKIMNLKPSSFSFKNDETNKLHYGFIAQELEDEYPELIQLKPDINYNKVKAINYLEIIPLLVTKMQLMQKEIDELREKISIS